MKIRGSILFRDFPEAFERITREALARCRDPSAEAKLGAELGYTLIAQRKLSEAREVVATNLARFPGHGLSLFCEAVLRFHMDEEWDDAWKGFEHRWLTGISGNRPIPESRQWDGSALRGRSVVLAGEGGLGDQIQFCRFARFLKAAGAGRVIVSIQEQLVPLLKDSPGVDIAIAATPEGLVPDCISYDVALPMLSAPFLLGLSKQQLAGFPPYIQAEPLLQSGSEKPRIGLCSVSRGVYRSFPTELFLPLLDDTRYDFYALGKNGDVDATIKGLPIRNLGTGNLTDAARAIASMDLVISTDTMPVHLAGAIGKPVWVLLHEVSDWRWGMHADTTPWYGTARLFRQTPDRSWARLIDRIQPELTKHFGS